MKRPSESQAKALDVINKAPTPLVQFDARTSVSLLHNGWAKITGDSLVITQIGRDTLGIEPIPANRPRLKPVQYTVSPALVAPAAAAMRAEPMMRVKRPNLPVQLPAVEDGMVGVCCGAFEAALKVELLVLVGGRVTFAKTSGKSWPVAFCPFCGDYRGGDNLNVDEEE